MNQQPKLLNLIKPEDERTFLKPYHPANFPGTNMGLLSELCSQLLKEVMQANPLKWVNHVNSAKNEVDELVFWKNQMKQDVDTMVTQIQTQLYTEIDVIFGDMNNIFTEEKEEAAQEITEAGEVD